MTELSNQKDGFCTAFFMLLVALCVISWYHWLVKKPNKVNPPLPPGPSVIQQVGDLFSLRRDPISYLDKLSKRYGPIIKFKYGARLCIVISSASVAKEVFKDHDTIFANHDDSVVAYAGTWGGTDLGWAPHGEDWRMLRKICALEFLNFSRLDALYYHRRREVRSMVSQLYSNSCNSINIGDYIFSSMFNGVTNMLWGGTLEGEEMKHFNAEVLEALENFLALLNSLNISDLFPVLAVLDIQGLATRMKKINTWFDKKFNFIIGRSLDKKDQKETKDFLQALLHVKECGDQKSSFSTTHIKGLLMDMLLGGSKTSAITVEWAMAELLRQPELMKKAQEELKDIVGMKNIVEESHCSQFHYINAILKETLRLHPAGPFLLPRCPSESCTVHGYLVPQGAKFVVNALAIQRDSTSWDNPLEFQPDRFLDSNGKPNRKGDYNGTNHSYIPLGSGRRVCVGIPLVERTLPYILASLLQSFNWKLPEGTTVDVSDTFQMVLKKRTPLIGIPTARLSDPKLYT